MSATKRFLVEFEIESHSCLVDGLGEQKLTSTGDDSEYILSNLYTKVGNEHPILSLRIVLDARDFGEAEEIGFVKATRFVRCLSFTANLPCKIHRITRIVDWTAGQKERGALIITSHKGHDLPYKVINEEVLRTVCGIISLNIKEEIYQSLKWHYYGTLSDFTDEQFQYFWLSLETLAQIDADKTKVNDLCAKCRSPLYCGTCKAYPKHRPYIKQRLEKLFNRVDPKTGQKTFDDASLVRNAISHGSDVTTLVDKSGLDFHALVNAVGRMSFLTILEALQNYSELQQEKNQYLFLQVSTFIKTTLTAKSEIFFDSKDPNSPSIIDVPDVKAEVMIGERGQSNP